MKLGIHPEFTTEAKATLRCVYVGLRVDPEATGSSQRLQELYDGVLVGAFQFFKLLSDVFDLAAVSGDGFQKC